MLSPYAEPYNPKTERLVHEKDKMEKVKNKQNKTVLETNQKKQESKDITRSGKNAEQNTKDTLNIYIKEQSKDEQIKVRITRQNNKQHNKY